MEEVKLPVNLERLVVLVEEIQPLCQILKLTHRLRLSLGRVISAVEATIITRRVEVIVYRCLAFFIMLP